MYDDEVNPKEIIKAVNKFSNNLFGKPELDLEDVKLRSKIKFRHGSKIRKKRPLEFRASGLPFCPVSWCFNVLDNKGVTDESDNISLGFFADFGTIAHLLFQRWSGFRKQIYGHWGRYRTIEKDGVVYKSDIVDIVVRNKVGPQITKEGEELIYEELLVREPKTGLGGHVDGLIPFLDGFLVIDYKTSSKKKNKKLTECDVSYKHQIMTYWYLLSKYGPWREDKKKYDKPLKIYGAIVMYIARDNPFVYGFNKESDDEGVKCFVFIELEKKLVERNFIRKRNADKALKTGDFSKVYKKGHCTCESGYGCAIDDFVEEGCGRPKRILKALDKSYKKNKKNVKKFYSAL